MGDVVPFDPGLDEEEVERLMYEHEGDIGAMAKALHVPSRRLRAFCLASRLLRETDEELHQLAVDESITVLRRLLKSDSMQNQFYAAKEWLRSNAGKRRGFGSEGVNPTIEVKSGNRTIAIRWLDPETTPEPKTIEGDVTGD